MNPQAICSPTGAGSSTHIHVYVCVRRWRVLSRALIATSFLPLYRKRDRMWRLCCLTTSRQKKVSRSSFNSHQGWIVVKYGWRVSDIIIKVWIWVYGSLLSCQFLEAENPNKDLRILTKHSLQHAFLIAAVLPLWSKNSKQGCKDYKKWNYCARAFLCAIRSLFFPKYFLSLKLIFFINAQCSVKPLCESGAIEIVVALVRW